MLGSTKNTLLERAWNAQQPAHEAIIRDGFGKAFGIDGNFFRRRRRQLTCVDGRVVCPKIALPGAGVMMTDAERETTAQRLLKAGVQISGIYPHRDCGAEATVRKELTAGGMSGTETNREIQRRYSHMATLLNTRVAEPAEMRKIHKHDERSLVFSAVHHIDTSLLSYFSPFLVNAKFMPSYEAALHTIPFCINIAFGPNGYGKAKFAFEAFSKFSIRQGDASKFLIVIIGQPLKSHRSCEAIRKDLQPLLEQAGIAKLVHVVGYDVPKKYLTQS